jgi:hypothetical protein
MIWSSIPTPAQVASKTVDTDSARVTAEAHREAHAAGTETFDTDASHVRLHYHNSPHFPLVRKDANIFFTFSVRYPFTNDGEEQIFQRQTDGFYFSRAVGTTGTSVALFVSAA